MNTSERLSYLISHAELGHGADKDLYFTIRHLSVSTGILTAMEWSDVREKYLQIGTFFIEDKGNDLYRLKADSGPKRLAELFDKYIKQFEK